MFMFTTEKYSGDIEPPPPNGRVASAEGRRIEAEWCEVWEGNGVHVLSLLGLLAYLLSSLRYIYHFIHHQMIGKKTIIKN